MFCCTALWSQIIFYGRYYTNHQSLCVGMLVRIKLSPRFFPPNLFHQQEKILRRNLDFFLWLYFYDSYNCIGSNFGFSEYNKSFLSCNYWFN
jgi:hypothetical protein